MPLVLTFTDDSPLLGPNPPTYQEKKCLSQQWLRFHLLWRNRALGKLKHLYMQILRKIIVNKLPISSVSVSPASWITLWSSGLLCMLSYMQLKGTRWLVQTFLIKEFVEVYIVSEGHPGNPHFCEKFTSLRCTIFKWDNCWLRKRQKNEQSAHFHSSAIEIDIDRHTWWIMLPAGDCTYNPGQKSWNTKQVLPSPHFQCWIIRWFLPFLLEKTRYFPTLISGGRGLHDTA